MFQFFALQVRISEELSSLNFSSTFLFCTLRINFSVTGLLPLLQTFIISQMFETFMCTQIQTLQTMYSNKKTLLYFCSSDRATCIREPSLIFLVERLNFLTYLTKEQLYSWFLWVLMHCPSSMVAAQCTWHPSCYKSKIRFSQLGSKFIGLQYNVIISILVSGSSWRGNIRKMIERDCTDEAQHRCIVESVLWLGVLLVWK